MFNRSASLEMSTSVLKAEPGKLDIKTHSPRVFSISMVKPITCCDKVKSNQSAQL